MEQKEFTIEALPNNTFRIVKLDPVEVLALGMTSNFEELKQTKVTMGFALEHIEVKVGEKWVLVKQPDRSVYMPMGIEDNLRALQQLIQYFIEDVLAKFF